MPSPETVKELPSSQRILQMLTGKWIAQAVSVAATLGIADLLVGGPQSVEQLAAATTTYPDSLHRLLRALASLGIFAENEDGRFTLTDLAQCLCSDAPDSMRNWARLLGLPLFWQSWGELLHSVKTGETGLKKVFGMTDPFGHFTQHPEDAKVFDGAMTIFPRTTVPASLRPTILAGSAKSLMPAEATEPCSCPFCVGTPDRTAWCLTCLTSSKTLRLRSRPPGSANGAKPLPATFSNRCPLAPTHT